MRSMLAVLLPLLCAACASPTEAPYAVEIQDRNAFTADLAACTTYAENYHPGFDASAVGEAALKGAASNASGAAVNVLVPALGGLGAATTETLNRLDIFTGAKRAVFVRCMSLKTQRDGSALVLEPNQ
jgi:hypothetical protein